MYCLIGETLTPCTLGDLHDAASLVEAVAATRRWRKPGLERLLTDLVVQIVKGDAALLRGYERELDRMEDAILADKATGAAERINEMRSELRDQALQMRDLYKMHLDVRQNHIMTALTIVTAVFAPLTLIVGWYGMNFENMPELAWPWGYPAVGALCLLVVGGCVAFFKHRKRM